MERFVMLSRRIPGLARAGHRHVCVKPTAATEGAGSTRATRVLTRYGIARLPRKSSLFTPVARIDEVPVPMVKVDAQTVRACADSMERLGRSWPHRVPHQRERDQRGESGRLVDCRANDRADQRPDRRGGEQPVAWRRGLRGSEQPTDRFVGGVGDEKQPDRGHRVDVFRAHSECPHHGSLARVVEEQERGPCVGDQKLRPEGTAGAARAGADGIAVHPVRVVWACVPDKPARR